MKPLLDDPSGSAADSGAVFAPLLDVVRLRRAGSGPRVIALHASGASGSQWQALMATLAARHEVLAPDHAGHGGTPAWDGIDWDSLSEHADLFAPLLFGSEGPVHLVGHSFGAVVALELARLYPQRVASLVLYEPVLMALLDTSPCGAGAELQAAAWEVGAALAAGRKQQAAQRFVDYWGGAGAWAAMPAFIKTAMLDRLPMLPRQFAAIRGAHALVQQLHEIRCPVLLLEGERTTRAAARIQQLLRSHLRNALHRRVAGAGHMGPVTHAAAVNEQVAAFLAAVSEAPAAIPEAQPLRLAA